MSFRNVVLMNFGATLISKATFKTKLDYDILLEFLCSTIVGILGTVGLRKSGYFSAVLCSTLWIHVIDAICNR